MMFHLKEPWVVEDMDLAIVFAQERIVCCPSWKRAINVSHWIRSHSKLTHWFGMFHWRKSKQVKVKHGRKRQFERFLMVFICSMHLCKRVLFCGYAQLETCSSLCCCVLGQQFLNVRNDSVWQVFLIVSLPNSSSFWLYQELFKVPSNVTCILGFPQQILLVVAEPISCWWTWALIKQAIVSHSIFKTEITLRNS